MPPYAEWFARFASSPERAVSAPREWQAALAAEQAPRSRLIQIPTGYGKTLGALGAWLYHRVARGDARWPRRLVWVLPMRVLVEQTAAEVRACLERLELLWQSGEDHRNKVGVHLLMGGTDAGSEWNLYPEEPAVFVSTQDMALSRALNRGYAAPRARWPMELGLLSQDALWVLDEVQLMDVGLASSAQLQAFFDDDAAAGRMLRPRLSWWMSATLQPGWLESVDTAARCPSWSEAPTTLSPSALSEGLATVRKSLELTEIDANGERAFAELVARVHAESPEPERAANGRVTLVVCNTVDRATRTYDALAKLGAPAELRLVHSRFRPHERVGWRAEFLSREACAPGVDRILIATQVVEAGVDLSATALVTELAPWSSIVQRFGRCARYGGEGRVVVVDRGRDERRARPYGLEEVEAAWAALERLSTAEAGVGIGALEAFEQSLSDADRARLYRYEPARLLLRRERDELFDTTPDLTGADVDVSTYIRSGDERDLSVFWVDVPAVKKGAPAPRPAKERRASREELCNVPFLAVRDWLCGKATKERAQPRLSASRRAWVWDWIEGEWRVADRAALRPGAVVCVAADTGGYHEERGFAPESKAAVRTLAAASRVAQDTADELDDTEALSAAAAYKTIATHGAEVAEEAARLARAVLPGGKRLGALLALAGHWHDLGKAHPAFQAIIEQRGPYAQRVDLAKAPDGAWQRPCRYRRASGEARRGFRHELASCLALFAVLERYEPTHAALLGPWAGALELLGERPPPAPAADPAEATPLEREVLACTAEEFDLLAYLVLAHHGKVRVALHAGPKDQEYVPRDGRGLPVRGVREGDALPAVALERAGMLPALTLTLAPAALGLSPATGRSWRERTAALLHTYGPGPLALLEALLIAADRRASKLTTIDPRLATPAFDAEAAGGTP